MKNKRVFISGANNGIGLSCVQALLKQGFSVHAVSRSTHHLTEIEHKNLTIVQADLLEDRSIEVLLDHIDRYPPHIIIANFQPEVKKKSLFRFTEEELHEQLGLGLKYLFPLVKKSLLFQKKEGFGRFIAISSASVKGSTKGHLLYNMQKHLLESLALQICTELKGKGITSNIIRPGYIETEGIKKRIKQKELLSIKEKYGNTALGNPENISSLVKHLVSEEAGFMNGGIYDVDGAIFLDK